MNKRNQAYLSRTKNSNELGVIQEETRLRNTFGSSNSQYSLQNSKLMDLSNISYLNGRSKLIESHYQKTHISSTSPRCVINPNLSDKQVVVINNRKLFASRSPSRSPPSQSTKIHNLKPQKMKSPGRNSRDKIKENESDKTRYLEKTIEEMSKKLKFTDSKIIKDREEFEKCLVKQKNAVAACWKMIEWRDTEIKQLKMKLDKYEVDPSWPQKQNIFLNKQVQWKNAKIQQLSSSKNIPKQESSTVQKQNIFLKKQIQWKNAKIQQNKKISSNSNQSEAQKQNIFFKKQIQWKNSKIKELQTIINDYKQNSKSQKQKIFFKKMIEWKDTKIKQLSQEVQEAKKVEYLKNSSGQNFTHNLNSVLSQIQESREEVRSDTQQYNIDEFLHNIQSLKNQNQSLKKQLNEKENEIQMKNLIASETAKVINQINLVVKRSESSNNEQMLKIENALSKIIQDDEDNSHILQKCMKEFSGQ